jgi:hypothetical protein
VAIAADVIQSYNTFIALVDVNIVMRIAKEKKNMILSSSEGTKAN